tara:strand:+ start:1594 stop:2157 length:564 start_codon:yes stop_codon:yes gene_type:complete
MTEKEKMLSGQSYYARDPELIMLHKECRKSLKELNSITSDNVKNRFSILENLLGKIDDGVWIESPFYCDYGTNISIGKNTFINFNCVFIDNNKIEIGSNVLIGPGVHFYTPSHPLKHDERIKLNGEYITSALPVKVGNNVWIGGNSTICQGVTIGNNSTIGAGSLVLKDIPDGVLAHGNPCKVIKKL